MGLLWNVADKIYELVDQSIIVSNEASQPGRPPHTRKGKLNSSLAINEDQQEGRVIIGTRYSVIKDIGGQLEHGGRPFMRPALEKVQAHFPEAAAGVRIS